MVALLCFCCDHNNPAGAKFCNACGTPLHLKPCTHCEAINTRAAAHCHQCGETFACDFLTPLAAAPMPDQSDAVEGQADNDGIEAPLQPPRRSGVRTRFAAILVGLTATAMLSAYYAYRQPGSGLADGGIVEPSLASAPPEAVRQSESAPDALSVPRELDGPTASPGSDRGGAESVTSVNGASPPKARATRVRAATKAGSAKPKANTLHLRAAPKRLATQPSVVSRDVGARPAPEGRRIAVAPAVATSPLRIAAAQPAPAQQPREVAQRRPAPAIATGTWGRPCAEGAALPSTCDVRMMPAGN